MQQKHLFIIDPLAKLDIAMDTSLKLAAALNQRGHQSYMVLQSGLSWQAADSCAMALAQPLLFSNKSEAVDAGLQEKIALENFQSIHMRKDPPFDIDYVTTTWLLDSVKKRVKLYNTPSGLRDLNEKLVIYDFPEDIAAALVSANVDQLMDFLEKDCAGDGILKPLTLYSGKGIFRVNLHEKPAAEIRLQLSEATAGGTSLRLLQPFDKAIFQGEVRAFTIGGRALAWCLKVPETGNYMANSSFGSTRQSYQPSAAEVAQVERISKELLKKGVSIVGYDLIGGKVSEINVTSPRLLTGIDDQHDYFSDFATWLEGDCLIL